MVAGCMRAQQPRGEHRNHRERQQQRCPQRKHDGQCHRAKQLAFQALQREQRQEHDHDDGDARAHGGGHLLRGPVQRVQARRTRLYRTRFDVFDHHHGGIDQHADGNRQTAQRHEVGRQPPLAHEHERGERRQRQNERHHQRRAQVAQEQQQQDEHQGNGFGKRLADRAYGALDQAATVVERHDLHAFWQAGLDLLQARLHVVHQLARIGTAQSQHQPLHGLALAVLRDAAVACQCAQAHLGHIAHAYGRCCGLPILRAHDNGAQIVQAGDAAVAAHQQRLFATEQAPGAVVAVVGGQRVLQLLQRHAPRRQPGHVGCHLESLNQSTQGVHVGHPGDAAQTWSDDEIEQLAPFGQRRVALDGEHEHLAQRGGDGRQPPADALGQIAHDTGQALTDLLACPVDVGAVGKVQRDVGNGVFGLRAQHRLVRNAQQFLLDGGDDACLNLRGRHARGLEDDLHLGSRDVREGVNGQITHRQPARAHQAQRQHRDQQALRQGKGNQTLQHHGAVPSWPRPSQAPLRAAMPPTATSSPTFNPERTGCMACCPAPWAAPSSTTGVGTKPCALRTNT